MNIEQLEQYKKDLKISIDKIIREEVEMIFLNSISHNNLGSKVIFYGGTALRLVYGSPRFSGSIDLIETKKYPLFSLKNLFKTLSKSRTGNLVM